MALDQMNSNAKKTTTTMQGRWASVAASLLLACAVQRQLRVDAFVPAARVGANSHGLTVAPPFGVHPMWSFPLYETAKDAEGAADDDVASSGEESTSAEEEEIAVEDKGEEKEEFRSAATEWASQQKGELAAQKKKNYVVVGGGWGGWGAAKALCEAGIDADVTLIDALPDPTGATPYLSKTGKPVEAGTRGFWKDYPNINAMCAELGIAEDDVFTPYTNSSFYSPDGLEATAPVFSEATLPFLCGGRQEIIFAVVVRPGRLKVTVIIVVVHCPRRSLLLSWGAGATVCSGGGAAPTVPPAALVLPVARGAIVLRGLAAQVIIPLGDRRPSEIVRCCHLYLPRPAHLPPPPCPQESCASSLPPPPPSPPRPSFRSRG